MTEAQVTDRVAELVAKLIELAQQIEITSAHLWRLQDERDTLRAKLAALQPRPLELTP